MYLIALTGGIAAGKSVVATRLAELGAVHIDADELARDVVKPGEPALARIAAEFGPTVIAADGSLDRAALGAIVFADPDQRALLNDITHPEVRLRAKKRMLEAENTDPAAIVVYDIPLLVESGPVDAYDLVLVVEASLDTRLRRLTKLRGMTLDEAHSRIASQATDEMRRAVADVVIDTDGSMDDTLAQVDEVWAHASAAATAGTSTSDCAGGKHPR